MKLFIAISFFLFSCLLGQVEDGGEANTAFDELSQEKTNPRNHMQAIDGVAAVVGERVILKSDINQTLAMAIFNKN